MAVSLPFFLASTSPPLHRRAPSTSQSVFRHSRPPLPLLYSSKSGTLSWSLRLPRLFDVLPPGSKANLFGAQPALTARIAVPSEFCCEPKSPVGLFSPSPLLVLVHSAVLGFVSCQYPLLSLLAADDVSGEVLPRFSPKITEAISPMVGSFSF